MAASKKININNVKNLYAFVAIALCVVSCYFFYDMVWTSFKDEEERLVVEQKNAQDELAKIAARKPHKPKLQDSLQRAEAEFERLKEMFPEEEKVPRRLQDLHAVVRASGVSIQTFKPNGRQEKEHFVENSYTFNVNAGYHMLGYLFAEIANFNYPTAINNLRLARSASITQEIKKADEHGWEPITMSVSFDLTTFTSKGASAP